MKQIVFGVSTLLVVALTLNTASAQGPRSGSDRAGFLFGGAPEYDGPPLASNDQEKQALAALDEISKGPW